MSCLANRRQQIRVNLTEDELEIFDLLKKEKLTKVETEKVRLASRRLLKRLKEEEPKVLVQDWHKDSRSQLRVRSAIESLLNTELPASYDRLLFKQKCDILFNQMIDYASVGRKWVS